jgi:hypothetical protein
MLLQFEDGVCTSCNTTDYVRINEYTDVLLFILLIHLKRRDIVGVDLSKIDSKEEVNNVN